MNNATRNINLDLLRIIAAFMVMLVHVGQLYEKLNQFTSIGSMSVQLFFIISGYLIMKSLENTNSIKYFYLKRVIHILPIYYITLIVLYCIDAIWELSIYGTPAVHLFSMKGDCGLRFLRYFGFLQLIIPSDNWDLWNNRYALWTLSSFAVFYLIAPFIYRMIRHFYISIIVLIYLLFTRDLVAGWIIQALSHYPTEGRVELFAYMTPVSELYCFFFGITLYYAFKDHKETIYALILAGTLILNRFGWYSYEIAFTMILLLAVKLPPISEKTYVVKIISALALSSFTLYLCHPIIIRVEMAVKNKLFPNINIYVNTLILIILILVATLTIWCFFQKLVEKKLEKKFINKI
ncbi:MAG: acyltransferase [Lachnospiraceae bacterium]